MKLRNICRIIPVIALILACTVSSLAWDEVGHKLTAIIAWEQMQPDVRERVFKILLAAPEESHLSTPYDAFNSRSEEIKRAELFMFASIWPDIIKNRTFENRNKKFNQSNWHYADIFWKQDEGAEILKDFDGAGGLAISKLADFEKIMRSSTYKDEEKALAIAWFLHVGGDIHNPVHNASRVTDTEPTGDQGGNLFVFVPRTDSSFGVNLHSYWDSIVQRVKPRKNDEWDTRYLTPIARKFMKKHKFESFEGNLKLGKYEAWNKEGFALLDSVVYNDIDRGSIPSKKYQKRAYKTARKQIALAGYRLGETFNNIFAKEEVSQKSGCEVIRVVRYPITKRRTLNQRLRIALLNICPPNKGMVARPVTGVMVDGEVVQLEFDLVRLFEDKSQAQLYAKANGINDISVD